MCTQAGTQGALCTQFRDVTAKSGRRSGGRKNRVSSDTPIGCLDVSNINDRQYYTYLGYVTWLFDPPGAPGDVRLPKAQTDRRL